MGKTLVIAEKPSVATDIAKALGGLKKTGDFYEGDEFLVASAVGHLLEIKAPDAYEVKRGKWSFTNLPVIPPHFELQPIKKSEAKLKSLAKLIRRKDVDQLINACDAGREGELIFRYIVEATKAKQPIRRLWLQSMTKDAIQNAFSHLRTDEEMASLADAAKSRSEADWLVGINSTRAMTAFNSREGGFFLTTVGRVQTPTLALVVKRESSIRKFIPQDYWEVHGTFAVAAGQYEGRYFDENFKKTKDSTNKAERLWSKSDAEKIITACNGKQGVVSEESKPSSSLAPALFDLTTLQREANSKFGFSAKTTLSIAQALYEKHKVLTYPRTDAKALPEDYLPTVKDTLRTLGEQSSLGNHAKTVLQKNWVTPNKRIFNNAKISDHFAIIPTTQQVPSTLSEVEQKIYDLVAKRFIAIFFPAAQFKITTRITRVDNYAFKTEGKILVEAGWLSVYGKETANSKEELVPIKDGENSITKSLELYASTTKPPARYTEATLLGAMESAGKTVEETELREAMAEKGIGTPATRASIIENLIVQGYLIREGRDLIPTAKAKQLLTLLTGLGVQVLSEAELTGEWEYKLALIEKGKLSRSEFMKEIGSLTKDIVEKAKSYGSNTIPIEHPAEISAPCPKCGEKIIETYSRFSCTHCDFSIPKHPGGRTFEPQEVDELISQGKIGPLQGFVSKMGRPFAAVLKLNGAPDYKIDFDFGNAQEENQNEPVDFSGQEPVGICPICGAHVFEQDMSYVCENTASVEKKCKFRSGKVILQQPISREQMSKLLTEGKTDLLTNFVSNRNHRKFSAYLVKDKTGKVGFEFEERTKKGSSLGRKTKTSGTLAQKASK